MLILQQIAWRVGERLRNPWSNRRLSGNATDQALEDDFIGDRVMLRGSNPQLFGDSDF